MRNKYTYKVGDEDDYHSYSYMFFDDMKWILFLASSNISAKSS